MMSNDQTKSIMETFRRMKYINCRSLLPGMTPAEISLLAAVCDGSAERKKVSDLYDLCAMQPTAVSRLMNSLEEKGLIERNVRKGNRRITDVLATDLGRKTDEKNRGILRSYWAQVLADVPEEDVQKMLGIMNAIMDSMETVLAAQSKNAERDTP